MANGILRNFEERKCTGGWGSGTISTVSYGLQSWVCWCRERGSGAAHSTLEVDEAVRAQGGDPTGGRGMSSDMNGQLGGEKEEETLNNAV